MATREELLAEIARRQAIAPPVAAAVAAPAAPQAVPAGVSREQVQAEIQRRQAALPQGFQQPSPAVAGVGQDPFAQGIREAFTGAARQTEATRTLPELREIIKEGDVPFGQGLQITAGLLATADPQQQIEIIQSAVPEAKIERDEKGNVIVDLGEGKRGLLNAPGFSAQDAVRSITQIIGFIPAGRLANLAKSVAARVGVGAAATGATEAARQAVTGAVGAEDTFRPGEIATAAALGGAAEIIPAAIQARRQAAAGIEGAEVAATQAAAQEAKAAAEATGVPLFQAQQAAIPAQLEKQAFLAQLPAGTQRATTALKAQNEAAATAVDDFLGDLAPPEAVVTGAEQFRTTAQRAVDLAKAVRAEKTSPLFNEAFEQGAAVNIKPVRDAIRQTIDDFPLQGEVAGSMGRILKLIGGRKIKVDGKPKLKQPSLKQLHNAKLEIDQMIGKFGENSLGNTTKREVLKIKEQLLAQMDEASDLYTTARETFAAESPAITQLQESLVGRIAGVKDEQLKSISRRIFDPAETNPRIVQQAKKVIDDIDPDAWNALLRSELERRIGSIKADVTQAGATTENVPGQLFNALFGNTKQRAVIFNSVDGEAAKNLRYLETVLKRARLGRPGGSQTAAREEIKRELRGGVTQSLRNFFSGPIRSLVSTGEDAAFNRRVRSMATAMFDPQFKPQMKQLRKLDARSPAAARAMTQLLNDAQQIREETNGEAR